MLSSLIQYCCQNDPFGNLLPADDQSSKGCQKQIDKKIGKGREERLTTIAKNLFFEYMI